MDTVQIHFNLIDFTLDVTMDLLDKLVHCKRFCKINAASNCTYLYHWI